MSGYELARISTINSLTSTLLSIPALILINPDSDYETEILSQKRGIINRY